jgi:hypothetical protein
MNQSKGGNMTSGETAEYWKRSNQHSVKRWQQESENNIRLLMILQEAFDLLDYSSPKDSLSEWQYSEWKERFERLNKKRNELGI